eukprot:4951650-Amphidinium_carterae.1
MWFWYYICGGHWWRGTSGETRKVDLPLRKALEADVNRSYLARYPATASHAPIRTPSQKRLTSCIPPSPVALAEDLDSCGGYSTSIHADGAE